LLNLLPGQPESVPLSGPNIAAAGLALMCPVVIPKRVTDLPEAIKKEAKEKHCSIMTEADRRLTDVAWVILFLFAGAWGYCLYLVHLPQVPRFYGFSEQWVIGIAIYFVAVLLTEIKEVA
jgi:hypothetical protein